ncbi:MAG TPA: oxidoreductase [Acidimicrobiia bacterium]|nr:oxidoreductase [Acidimicrobiia bacterium]
MPWTTADIPDLSGRVAVVTGANGGLGLECAKALAGAGAVVVMAAHSQDKARAAREEILAAFPAASPDIVEFDLASLDSVRAAAAIIAGAHPVVDILVNNAGLMATPERRTADGFEVQFGVNHLGHWVFTARLMASLIAAEAARVVTVTSTARHFGRRVDPANPNLEGTYGAWKAYGQSKLANHHFAIGLQREFDKRGLAARSLVAHPGLSLTDLQVRAVEGGAAGWVGRLSKWLAATTGMEASRGALSQVRAATDPNARGGQMYAPRFVNTGAPVRRPILRRQGLDRSIEILWDISERMTGESLGIDAALDGA